MTNLSREWRLALHDDSSVKEPNICLDEKNAYDIMINPRLCYVNKTRSLYQISFIFTRPNTQRGTPRFGTSKDPGT